MNIQGSNADQTPYKIVFSNILCRIKITQQGLYGLVIRLGKKSSKYSDKKPIKNGVLQLNNVLQIPFNDRVLSNQCIRKDKVNSEIIQCEIMLYRFKMNGQRESKELIGMASLSVGNQLFQQQIKKLRLTNSNDKQASVHCKVKIQLGEADILSTQNESRFSSFLVKSNDHSTVNETHIPVLKQPQVRSDMKVGLITSNSQKSFSMKSQSIKEDNSFLQMLSSNSPQNNHQNKLEKSSSKSQSQLISVTQPSVTSVEIQNSSYQLLQEKNHLSLICNDLQKQNQLLISKIENLQNQLFNQSIISNNSLNDRPQIPRPSGNIKRSPMIKKNATIMVAPVYQKQQENVLQNLVENKQGRLISQKSAGSLHNHKSILIKSNEPQKTDRSNSPFFSAANPASQIEIGVAIEQSQIISHMTFAEDKIQRKNFKLSIDTVIGVTFKPPVNSSRFYRHQVSYNERQNSVTNRSGSDCQRKDTRSYSKFSGKKNYQIIGTLKSPDQSQNFSYLEQQSRDPRRKKSASFITSKPLLKQKSQKNLQHRDPQGQGFFRSLTNQASDLNGNKQNNNVFLDFLNENNQKEENPFAVNINHALQGVLHPVDTRQNIPQQEIFNKSRVTLEELDIKTEQRFRKNERSLKIANMRILEENINLKKQKKELEKIIEQKKQLSHQQFYNLKNEIKFLTDQLEHNKSFKLQNESKLIELMSRCTSLEQENSKLKKDIKQQKNKYQFYLKLSNVNDHKDKEKDIKVGSQVSLKQKKSSTKQDSQIFSSFIEQSKSGVKNVPVITSIMNISGNEESTKHRSMIDKKVDFTVEGKVFDEVKLSTSYYEKKVPEQTAKPNIPKPSSSFAISKLKQQFKPGSQRQRDESVQIGKSPFNSSFQALKGSGFMGGLIGTGDTIVHRGTNFVSSFGQK